MKVTMFQSRFASLVESGAKTHTIRPRGKHMPRVGEWRSLRTWTGKPYRSKQRVLREAQIAYLYPVEIMHSGPVVSGCRLMWNERDQFAQRDGFKDWNEMRDWYEDAYGLPFRGVLMKWSNIQDEGLISGPRQQRKASMI